MQTLSENQYLALANKYRKPNSRVYIQRNYDSIPFEGKTIQTTLTSERYPKTILHTDGRLSMVYSKYDSVQFNWETYYKCTNLARTSWESSVLLLDHASYNYTHPCIVQLKSSNNLAVVASRNNTDLFYGIIDADGTVVTAFADSSFNGQTPSIACDGTNYWLFYERSGKIYYRTSADFSSWNAEVDFTTKTGLANNHYNPCVYYDSNGKIWVVFEYVTEPSASPVVKNVYSIYSTNGGTTWSTPNAQTVLAAGEGSAILPSITDIVSERYLSYTIEKQIQNYEYENSTYGMNRFVISDDENDRVLFITGDAYTNYRIVEYDIVNTTYTYHLLSDHGMTAGSVTCFDYDPDNNVMVVGTTDNGLIVYNESSVSWSNYTTSTTPATRNNYIKSLRIKNNKIYYSCVQYTPVLFGLIDLSASSATSLAGDLTVSAFPYRDDCWVSDSYIVFFVKTGSSIEYPTVRVYSVADLSLLHSGTIGSSTTYQMVHQYESAIAGDYGYQGATYDETNDIMYVAARDVNASDDNGIAVYQIGASASSFIEYWSNAIGNSYGLLPNPDISNKKRIAIVAMFYKNNENRLYITQNTTADNVGTQVSYVLTAINTVTKAAIGYWSEISSTDYASVFPAIDSSISKVLPDLYYARPVLAYRGCLSADEEGNVIYNTFQSSEYRWHILSTDVVDQRVYYQKSDDDATWTAGAFLTKNTKDNYCSLNYSDGRLKAFWERQVDNIYELRWDEDLSAQINVSSYVESFTIEQTDEFSANKAVLILSDSLGLFDPLNYSSLWHDYFAENNIITIQKGNNGEYNNAFYGFISSGESNYSRGSQIIYRIECFDKSKNYFEKKVTTPFFESKTISYIAAYIAQNYMGLAAEEYATLPTINETITVQFIDEYVMDILFKIYQPFNYFPMFDESGNLVAKEYNYEATTNFTYYQDGTDSAAANKSPAFNIVEFNYEWTDKELVNKVTVIGETPTAAETTFDEEYMGYISGAAGWFSKSTTFDFHFSQDDSLYCVEPRLDIKDSCGNRFFGGGESLSTAGTGKQTYCVVTQNVSNLITPLYVLMSAALMWTVLFGFMAVFNGLAIVVSMAITILGQVGNFYYDIYAKPVGDAVPETITAVADDDDLQLKYGTVEKTIDNPFVTTYAKCSELAENELTKAKWFRYIPTLKILSNMAHQIGDVIDVYNPHTANTYKIYITEITRSYTRGKEDCDVIKGGLII